MRNEAKILCQVSSTFGCYSWRWRRTPCQQLLRRHWEQLHIHVQLILDFKFGKILNWIYRYDIRSKQVVLCQSETRQHHPEAGNLQTSLAEEHCRLGLGCWDKGRLLTLMEFEKLKLLKSLGYWGTIFFKNRSLYSLLRGIATSKPLNFVYLNEILDVNNTACTRRCNWRNGNFYSVPFVPWYGSCPSRFENGPTLGAPVPVAAEGNHLQ